MATVADVTVAKIIREIPVYASLLESANRVVGDKLLPFIFRSHTGDVGDLPSLYERARFAEPWRLAEFLAKNLADPYVRAEVARELAERLPIWQGAIVPEENLSQQLIQEGFAPLSPLLDQRDLTEMVTVLQSHDNLIVEGTTEQHRVADIVAAPHAFRIATAPSLLGLATEFLNCAPTIVNIEAWWSPKTRARDYGPQEVFHRDKEDFRECKFFMYLTDVGSEGGPHVYARRSSDPDYVKSLVGSDPNAAQIFEAIFTMNATARRFAPLNEAIFQRNLVEIRGPAGTSFMTNSYGLHRGTPPESGRRGMFAITYGMVAYRRRIERLAGSLQKFPADCIDTPLARYAARLLLS